MSKYCLGTTLVGPGHEVEDFFTGLRCPVCLGMKQREKEGKEIEEAHIEGLKMNFLFNHPEVLRRMEREDGGFGA